MTSIFQGQLYRNFVKDQNTFRLESYDVNRFQRTVQQQTAQSQREKTLREGLELHQAIMADLQTKLNEVSEKLNNLYRRYMENEVSFKRVGDGDPYHGTSAALNTLRNVTDTTAPYNTGHPAGPAPGGANILPYDSPERIKNYGYNPYFGSKAIDESGNSIIRTNYIEDGLSLENAYKENGAFWSTISYLWGWDLDRINATYATTQDGLPVRGLTGDDTNSLQVNVTALQPNRPQYPPLRAGDRFPIKYDNDPNPAAAPSFPYVNVGGIRPGGADYSHAQVSAGYNDVGQDSLNWGWEFDDLPLALQVTGVEQAPDGSYVPTGYKVVYDIPLTHPQYDRYRHLDGTEPLILDAPETLVKNRIHTTSFDYAGFIELTPQSAFSGTYGTHTSPIGSPTGDHPPGSGTSVGTYPIDFRNQLMGSIILEGCQNFGISSTTRVSFDYTYAVEQREIRGSYNSPGDDGALPGLINGSGYNSHNWGGTSTVNPYRANVPPASPPNGGPPEIDGVQLGSDMAVWLGLDNTSNNSDPFHSGSVSAPPVFENVAASNQGVGGPAGTGAGGGIKLGAGEAASFASASATSITIAGVTRTIYYIDTANDIIYVNSPGYSAPSSGVVVTGSPAGGGTTVSGSGTGMATGLQVNDGSTFAPYIGQTVHITDGTTTYIRTLDAISGNYLDLSLPPLPNIVGSSYRVEIPGSGGPGTTAASTESLRFQFRQDPSQPDQLILDIYFDGDIHGLDVAVSNFKIVSYGGNLGSWTNGLYNGTDTALGNGPLPITGDPQDVLNKYETDRYNFTQFYNEYDNIGNNTVMNDIVRSPYEYGLLNIGRESEAAPNLGDSGLYGEMWVDINDRRLNLQPDQYNSANQPDWSGTATFTGDPQYQLSTNVTRVYDFETPEYPGDDCVPPGSPAPAGTRTGQTDDANPFTNDPLNDLGTNHIGTAPPDPMRVATIGGSPAIYYSEGGASNGGATSDGEIDRIAGNDTMDLRVTIPTTDLNILKKENSLVFNLGSQMDRNYGIDINEPYIEYRSVSAYQTLPRYRVDASGNIYDRFGKGFYNYNDPTDFNIMQTLYTTRNVGVNSSIDPLRNGQVSNMDMNYQNDANYDSQGSGLAGHDRMSQTGDDYNLFDYVPDLVEDPLAGDPEVKRGEMYVGSVPTNFYYYRESLDQSLAGPTGSGANNDNNQGAINFDGRKLNTDGDYVQNHTVVHNNEMPSFVNVVLGYAEQDARYNNSQATTSFATWEGFPGLGGVNQPALTYSSASGVTTPTNMLGMQYEAAAIFDDGGSMVVDTFTDSSAQGHLLIYELVTDFTKPPERRVANVLPGPGDPHPAPDPTPDTGAAGSPVYVSDTSFLQAGDGIFYDNGTTVTPIIVNSVNPVTGAITFSPPLAVDAEGVIYKEIPFRTAIPHAIPLPLEPGYAFSFDSYNVKKSMTRTGAETKNGYTYLHVDNATPFVTSPLPATLTVTIATTPPQTRTITPTDVDVSTEPHVIRVQPPLATLPGYDVAVFMQPPTFSVTVGDGATTNSQFTIAYDDNGTGFDGEIVSLQLSPEMDRVGRFIADDPRTAVDESTTANAVAPEYFDDTPQGYVQPDALLNLNLVGKDVNGNMAPRRLKEVTVTIDSGEQIILGANGAIRQVYNTNESSVTAPDDLSSDPTGAWPMAIYDSLNELINPTSTNDLGVMVGYFQGVRAGATTTSIPLTSVADFPVGKKVTINGETRFITAVNTGTNTLTLDAPLTTPPRLGDTCNLGTGTGTEQFLVYLNRSFAMSTNAPVKIDMIWDDYEVSGYPPMAVNAGRADYTETIGFTKALPGDDAPNAAYQKTDYLVANKGRTGGSTENEFTKELKRIIDNPEYAELFRHDLFKNVFINASVNDPFNDLVSAKLMLTWDRYRRHTEILGTSFMAYFKSA